MIVRWSAVLVLAACGRLGFDPLATDDAMQSDAIDDDAPGDTNSAQCPTDFMAICGGCYKHFSVDTNWLDAETMCENAAINAHLAVIGDTTEEQCLIAAANSPPRLWMGFTERITDGTFLTVTGQPQLFFRWEPPEPDDTIQDCIEYRAIGWADEPCTDINPFYCEHDGVPADPASY